MHGSPTTVAAVLAVLCGFAHAEDKSTIAVVGDGQLIAALFDGRALITGIALGSHQVGFRVGSP